MICSEKKSVESDFDINDFSNVAYLQFECTDTSVIAVEKIVCVLKNDFDILSVLQTGDDEYILTMNNPIDTNTLPLVTVNKETAEYEFADPYTLIISHLQNEGEVNISISGIKDIFGSTVTKTCELYNCDMTDSYVISKPILLFNTSGIYLPANTVLPGDYFAILDIKKAD